MYDLVSGTQRIKWSYFVSKTKALEQFPHLKRDKLAGAIVYYDGKHMLGQKFSKIFILGQFFSRTNFL